MITKNQNQQWPTESEVGLIQTMNSMGIMTKELSPVALQFIEDASVLPGCYLDIGAAYGLASHKILETGAQVVACDISKTHLDILVKTAPKKYIHNLTIDHSAFPYETLYHENSMNGILISLVLHFLSGDDIEFGMKKCYAWLKPGGKIYLNVITPNLSFYYKCWPTYTQRSLEGIKWPGMFLAEDIVSARYLKHLPKMIHLFDQDVLARLICQAGFNLIHNNFFCYNNFPEYHKNNGKEFLGAIGVK